MDYNTDDIDLKREQEQQHKKQSYQRGYQDGYQLLNYPVGFPEEYDEEQYAQGYKDGYAQRSYQRDFQKPEKVAEPKPAVQQPKQKKYTYKGNTSIFWDIIFISVGFLVPIAGVMLYWLFRSQKPRAASLAAKSAYVSVCINMISYIIYFMG